VFLSLKIISFYSILKMSIYLMFVCIRMASQPPKEHPHSKEHTPIDTSQRDNQERGVKAVKNAFYHKIIVLN
jgi:hypothetical protein